MSNPDIDLARIAHTLGKHGVDYVLVGGMAVVIQGGGTTTFDVDLTFDRSAENIERLANALEELGAKPKRWLVDPYRLQPSDLSSRWLHMESDAGDIDLIAQLSGLTYEQLKKNCDRFELDREVLCVASIPELIEMKRPTGRLKDARHLSELEELMRLKSESE